MESEEFLRMWEQCQSRLRYRILKITRNPDITDDLLQEAFVKAYPHAHRLDYDAAKYLMRTATNIAFDYIRHNRIWKMEYRPLDQVCEDTPHDFYCKRERNEFFHATVAPAIRGLPERQRAALRACAVAPSHREAALALGIPPSTLRHREMKAVFNLRKRIRRAENLPKLNR